MLGLVDVPRVGRGFRAQALDARRAEPVHPLLLGLDVEHPLADPRVVVVATRRRARIDPEVVVLAVPGDGQIAGVQTAGVGAERCLDDREHAVRRDANEVRPRPEVVDDLLDGHDRAAPGRERAPYAFEQRRMQRDVAGAVGDGRVQQRDVGLQRREQPDRTERGIDPGVRLVLRHRRAFDRAGRHGGEPPRGRLESLREREERPVLDLDLAPLVGAARTTGSA